MGAYRLYEEDVQRQPSVAIANQVSFTRWLSADDFLAIVSDRNVIGVEKVIFLLTIASGTEVVVPVTLPAGTDASRSIDVGLARVSEVFGRTPLTLVDGTITTYDAVLPDIVKTGGVYVGAAHLRTTTPLAGLQLWIRQRSIVRLSVPIRSDQVSTPRAILPGQVIE